MKLKINKCCYISNYKLIIVINYLNRFKFNKQIFSKYTISESTILN